jgi:alpha-beta hydrolase superfamily lysophospholipase
MMKHTRLKNIFVVLLFLFIALNAIAFMHAYKMTHFTSSGEKPIKPEFLTFRQKFITLFTGVNVPKPETVSIKPSFKYETLHYPGYKGNELEAWYAKGPEKDTLVIFFHGYIESKIQLVPEAEKFYSKGYSVMLVDFYGSGGSRGNSTSVGYFEADDVKASYEKAKSLGYKRIIMFAVSMGSAAALRGISLYKLQPDCLIIESPFAGLLDTVKRRFDIMNAPLVFWGGIIEGYDAFAFHPSEYAKDLKMPVLLLHGAKDKRVSTKQAELIYDNLGGKKKMAVFPEAGHLSFMKTDEKTWDGEVFGFIEGCKRIAND